MRDIDVPVMEQENLTEGVGVQVVFPEKVNEVMEEIPIPTTVPQANEFGPDVYVLDFVPPLKEKQNLKHYHNPNFVINHDHDLDIPPSNPNKKPNTNLKSLKGQSFNGHHRYR